MTSEPPEQRDPRDPADPRSGGPAGPSDPYYPYPAGPDAGGDDDDTHVLARAAVPEPDDNGHRSEPEPPQIAPEELEGLQGDVSTSTAIRRVLPLEDEASGLVARYLFPTERYRGEWKRHRIHLIWPMVWGLLATFLLGWLSGLAGRWDAGTWLTWILVLAWVVVMGYVAWRVTDWHFDRFILTNKRIMKIEGIITRNVAMMPLLRVTDMKYLQTPLGRMLNYGTFIIESAGQEQALREVEHLPNPNELYLRVVEEMYEPAAVEARMGGSADESEEEHRAGDS